MIEPGHLEAAVAEVLPTVVEVRRTLHRHPELAHHEFATTDLIVDRLTEVGLTPTRRSPQTGLYVDVGNGERMVGFRADIDALPIDEPPGLAFASAVPGVMHACGHDAHAAIGVGVALVAQRLLRTGLDLPARVRVIFQPAEESMPGGAVELVSEGWADGLESILAFHVDPSLETGRIGLRAGAITSSSDRFSLILHGPGGHTARPHETVDLLFAAGMVITQLPALIDRLIDARAPVVLVFGRVHSGTADNVIPTRVEMSGTIRSADKAIAELLPELVERLVGELLAPVRANFDFQYMRGIPPVINDPVMIRRIETVVTRVLGGPAVFASQLSMGAEDFSRFLEVAPGALLRLGCGIDGKSADIHSAGFVLDEGCLEVGVRTAMAALVELMTA